MFTCTFYKTLFIGILFFCLLPAISHAQDVYEGQVINQATELPLQGVTITLAQEKTATQTNEQGYFKLIPTNSIANDTLVFTSVGYQTYRLPISAYQKQMFIMLKASNTQLDEVNISNRKIKTVTLKKFSTADVKYVNTMAYKNITTLFYTRSVFAKQFEAPQNNVMLASIQLGRRDFEVLPQAHTSDNKFTRFLVHVMDIDSNSVQPGKILFTKEVSLADNSLLVRIDLNTDKVIIPKTKFFVAVEWLRIPYNEVVQLKLDAKVRKVNKKGEQLYDDTSAYTVHYQPFLVGYELGKRSASWVKINNIWEPYADPKNEIALSATIRY